jgi:ABC-2 type transport system permease protein
MRLSFLSPPLLWAFLRRDYLTQLSYRSAFLLSFVGIFFRTATFFFISQFVGEMADPTLASYGVDYFSFVIIGLAFNLYFEIGLNAFASGLREAQTTGTLEAMMLTPTPVSALVVGSAVWSYAFTTLKVFIYLAIGSLLGLDLSRANWGLALLGLGLSVIAFASIGIIAASVIMVIKRGDPVTTLIAAVSALVGGVYYPVEVLPTWLQFFSYLVPITYALRVMRYSLLVGASVGDVAVDLLVLVGFCLLFFPLSLLLFRWAVDVARRDGSLAQY